MSSVSVIFLTCQTDLTLLFNSGSFNVIATSSHATKAWTKAAHLKGNEISVISRVKTAMLIKTADILAPHV